MNCRARLYRRPHMGYKFEAEKIFSSLLLLSFPQSKMTYRHNEEVSEFINLGTCFQIIDTYSLYSSTHSLIFSVIFVILLLLLLL